MNWEDAYEQQLAIWQFWGTDAGRRFARGYASAIKGIATDADRRVVYERVDPTYVATVDGEAEWLRAALIPSQRAVLLEGDPIAVDDDMMTLWQAAAEKFEPEPLQPADLMVRTGFVYLPRPAYLTDIHGKRLSVRGIAWGPIVYASGPRTEIERHDVFGQGILLALYSRRGDPDDYFPAGELPTEWSLAQITPWAFGESYERYEAGLGMARQVQSLLRLLQQTIFTRSDEHPSRPTRRRAAKADFPAKKVVVMRLRRPTAPPRNPEPGQPAWSHRWVVTGHWRNQWYPSLGPASDPAAHRQIWISQYVKGPDDKPLQLRTVHAYELVR